MFKIGRLSNCRNLGREPTVRFCAGIDELLPLRLPKTLGCCRQPFGRSGALGMSITCHRFVTHILSLVTAGTVRTQHAGAPLFRNRCVIRRLLFQRMTEHRIMKFALKNCPCESPYRKRAARILTSADLQALFQIAQPLLDIVALICRHRKTRIGSFEICQIAMLDP